MEVFLSFRSYIPKRIEVGMLFLANSGGEPYVFRLERTPIDEERFIKEVGYPVEPVLIEPTDNPDVYKEIVDSDLIGWMDEGEFTDELIDIEPRHFNRILSGYDGWVLLEVEEDEEGNIVPAVYGGKITLSYADDDDDEEEDFS